MRDITSAFLDGSAGIELMYSCRSDNTTHVEVTVCLRSVPLARQVEKQQNAQAFSQDVREETSSGLSLPRSLLT